MQRNGVGLGNSNELVIDVGRRGSEAAKKSLRTSLPRVGRSNESRAGPVLVLVRGLGTDRPPAVSGGPYPSRSRIFSKDQVLDA
jgi:hypothetical protein